MKNKRILFMISSLDTGGAQRALSNIVCNFPEDWEIDILLNNTDNMVYPYKGNVIDLKIKNVEKRDSLFYQCFVFIKRLCLLYNMKKEGNYKACISFIDSANIANIITGNKHCKVIVSERIHLTETTKTSLKYKYIVAALVKMFYGKADKIVGCAKDVSDDLIKNYGIPSERICTIYNGYDSQAIQKDSESTLTTEESKLFQRNRVIITSGRLELQKGQWHLIRALQEVKKEIPDVKLIIMGEGNLRNSLETLTRKLGLQDSVCFTGFVHNPYKYIRNSELFILPSLYEGFPNVLAEALICGKPCIASDFHSGAREILAPDASEKQKIIFKEERVKYGILVPCMEPDKIESTQVNEKEHILAEAIIELLKNQELKKHYQQQALIRAKELSIDGCVEQWLKIIEA